MSPLDGGQVNIISTDMLMKISEQIITGKPLQATLTHHSCSCWSLRDVSTQHTEPESAEQQRYESSLPWLPGLLSSLCAASLACHPFPCWLLHNITEVFKHDSATRHRPSSMSAWNQIICPKEQERAGSLDKTTELYSLFLTLPLNFVPSFFVPFNGVQRFESINPDMITQGRCTTLEKKKKLKNYTKQTLGTFGSSWGVLGGWGWRGCQLLKMTQPGKRNDGRPTITQQRTVEAVLSEMGLP